MRIAVLVVVCGALAACHHATRPVAPRPATVAPPVAIVREPAWPVPMRAFAWTDTGVVPLGELPLATTPASRWYVEPTVELDAAAFAKVVAGVRRDRIPGLSLRGQPLDAARLAQLGALPELTALVLDDTALDGAGLDALATPLERLYIARTAIDDAAIARLAARMPALEVLDASGTALGDAGAKAIAALHGLHALDLANTRLGDDGGAALGALADLAVLDVSRTRIGAKTIAAIRGLRLHELYLQGTRVGPEIATLAGLAPGLTHFDASDLATYKPGDAELAWLANAPWLVRANLAHARIHDKLALAIVALPKLRELSLAGTAITAATIAEVAARTDLEDIDLAETPVDDAHAAAMLGFPKLRALRLDATRIGDAALRAAPSATLVELYLTKTAVGDAGLAILGDLPQLQALGLGETRIGDATLVRVAALAQLKTLVLTAVTARAFDKLGALRNLERLYLRGTHTTDAAIDAIAQNRGLRTLHVDGSDLTDAALASLAGLSRLGELAIGDTRLTGALCHAIAGGAWPHLHTLSASSLDIDDAALAELAARKSLAVVDVSATEVHDPAALAALPDLRVLGVAALRLSPAGQATVKALAARGVEIVR